MDNSLKGLLLAAGVVITCIVVGLGFYISREAKNTSSGGISQISKMSSEYQDVNKTLYDGIQVSGREVIEAIEALHSEITNSGFAVTVVTGKARLASGGAIQFTGSNYPIDAAKNVKDNKYINPDGEFLGKAISDDNGVITSLTFEQQ